MWVYTTVKTRCQLLHCFVLCSPLYTDCYQHLSSPHFCVSLTPFLFVFGFVGWTPTIVPHVTCYPSWILVSAFVVFRIYLNIRCYICTGFILNFLYLCISLSFDSSSKSSCVQFVSVGHAIDCVYIYIVNGHAVRFRILSNYVLVIAKKLKIYCCYKFIYFQTIIYLSNKFYLILVDWRFMFTCWTRISNLDRGQPYASEHVPTPSWPCGLASPYTLPLTVSITTSFLHQYAGISELRCLHADGNKLI